MTIMRVLIVDDAPEVRRLIEEVLKLSENGWRVVAGAGDGRQGIEQARNTQPDLVLLDISMPVMDGLEALPLVRAAAPGAAIVVLTGFPSAAARDSALQAGADGYLVKEDLVQSLVPRLEAILAALPPREAEHTHGAV